jgi:hypothetical protein
MIYLYIKTCNHCGLKYLGKTIKDPFKYKGSGTYWKRHIKKYGYDVTTDIVFETKDKEELKNIGIYFSYLYNVIKSDEWANLKEEAGDGAGKGFIHSEETKLKQAEKAKGNKRGLGTKRSLETKEKISKKAIGNTNFLGKHHSEETKIKQTKVKSKTWKVTSPFGEEKIIINLKMFCEKNNLSYTHMATRKYGSKGWRAVNIELKQTKKRKTERKARSWKIISPSNEEFVIVNLEQYCKENNLHSGHIAGKYGYKGWKATKILD